MKFITKYPLRITIPIFLFVAGIIISVYSVTYTLRAADAEVEDAGMTFVRHNMSALQGTVTSFLQEGNVKATRLAISSRGSTPNIEFVLLADENNVVLHATRREFFGLPLPQAVSDVDVDLINEAKKTMSGKVILSKDRVSISAYYPVVIGGKEHELRPSLVGILFMKYDLTSPKEFHRYDIEHQAWQSVALYNFLFLSLGIILYYTLTKRVLALVDAVKRFEAGEMSVRSGLEGRDELAQLGQAFDSMIVTIAREQSERHDAQKKLGDSHERLTAVLNGMEAIVYVADMTTYEVIFLNQYALDIFGDIVGKICWQTIQQDQSGPCEFCTNSQLLDAEGNPSGVCHWELQNTKNGCWYDIRDRAIRWIDGRIVRMEIATDITERKKAEQQLEQKNAELERFTYTVSHDLKSPIITIKGFLGTLVADARAGKIERMESDIKRIAGAADKMQALLEDVLELSRIGRMINPSVKFSMTKAAKEAIEGLAGMIRAKGVTVTIEPDMPVVLADLHRIREVLQNLIENAVKYMGNQTAPRIEVGCRFLADGQQAYFVRDNGIGIDQKFKDKIFGLFEKLDTHSEGTGIGLALVKRIIELHNGTIWVESADPDQGSIFYFTLPQQTAQEERA